MLRGGCSQVFWCYDFASLKPNFLTTHCLPAQKSGGIWTITHQGCVIVHRETDVNDTNPYIQNVSHSAPCCSSFVSSFTTASRLTWRENTRSNSMNQRHTFTVWWWFIPEWFCSRVFAQMKNNYWGKITILKFISNQFSCYQTHKYSLDQRRSDKSEINFNMCWESPDLSIKHVAREMKNDFSGCIKWPADVPVCTHITRLTLDH